jgi:hypothetical protein
MMSNQEEKEDAKPATETALIPGQRKDLFAEIREKLEMADAMREIFDEDKVTHEHGSAEPEGD